MFEALYEANKIEVFHLTVISKHTKINDVLVIEAHYCRFFHLNKMPFFSHKMSPMKITITENIFVIFSYVDNNDYTFPGIKEEDQV